MAIKVDVGTAAVTVTYNLETEKPEVAVTIDVADSNPFGVTAALRSLAGAARRMADEIEKTADNPSRADITVRSE